MAELLSATLTLFPLDVYEKPVYLMEKVPGDTVKTPIWDEYREILKPYTNEEQEFIERFAFYERAKNAYFYPEIGFIVGTRNFFEKIKNTTIWNEYFNISGG